MILEPWLSRPRFSLIFHLEPYWKLRILEPWLARPRFSLISNEIIIKSVPFLSPGWPDLDFHWFPMRSSLETCHFGALGCQDKIFSGSQLNSLTEDLQFLSTGWPGLDFHWFPVKSWFGWNLPFWSSSWRGLKYQWSQIRPQIETHHFGDLAGQA